MTKGTTSKGAEAFTWICGRRYSTAVNLVIGPERRCRIGPGVVSCARQDTLARVYVTRSRLGPSDRFRPARTPLAMTATSASS